MDTFRDIEQNINHVWFKYGVKFVVIFGTLHVLTLYLHFVPKSAFLKICK